MMEQSFEFEGSYVIIRYAIIAILVIIVLRYLGRLLKPPVFAFMLNYFGPSANANFRSDLFESLAELNKASGKKLRILEIGIGGGFNFKYYPKNSQVIAVEPNGSFNSYIQKNVQKYEDVQLLQVIDRKIEDLGTAVKDESVDVVVSTLVLCSVQDMDRAMSEIKRVLKPNGRFYFIEHVKDFEPNSWIHITQRLLHPIVLAWADCDCLRDTHTYIGRAGFRSHTYKQMHSDSMPFVVSPTIVGYATK